jgi:ring-1,2-phenylacetyl-CoA epoxidase subunit PaaE
MFGRPRKVVLARPQGASKRWERHGEVMPRRPVRVAEIIRETADAVTLVLEFTDGKPLEFRAGQYLTHFFVIDGVTHKRAYSLSSAEGQKAACTIKAVPGGVVSAHVMHKLQPGDRYWVLGPSGDFTLADESRPLAFIAGGSGITPVMSMLLTALARQPQRRIELLYSNHSEADTIFAQALAQLCAAHTGLRVTSVHTQAQGRLTATRIADWAKVAGDADFFLCGPTGLMDTAAQALSGAGVPAARIRREQFLAAARETQQRPAEPQEIFFARSGKRVQQRSGESILDTALRESVAINFSCTVGGCGSCKVRVSAGQCALNEPNCLTPEEKAQGYTLACSAFAAQAIVVDA